METEEKKEPEKKKNPSGIRDFEKNVLYDPYGIDARQIEFEMYFG